MWFTLDPALIIENISVLGDKPKATSVKFDIPSNMEVLVHKSNSTVEIKFFYYAGGTESTTQQVLQHAVADIGTASKRLFSISAKDIPSIINGVQELILGAAKPRTECNLQAAKNSIILYKRLFTHVEPADTANISSGQKLEKILQMSSRENLEYMQGLLESSNNLGISTISQLMIIIDMYLSKE